MPGCTYKCVGLFMSCRIRTRLFLYRYGIRIRIGLVCRLRQVCLSAPAITIFWVKERNGQQMKRFEKAMLINFETVDLTKMSDELLHSLDFRLGVSLNLKGSLIDSMYMGLVFLSIQLDCVFWLEHLIYLHLR